MSIENLARNDDIPASAELKICPLAGRIGAEIRNVRISGDLSADVVDGIQAALARYKVIFFRQQTHVDDALQEEFAKRLGKILPHPNLPIRSGTKGVIEFDGANHGRDDRWHTDMSYVGAYPIVSILRAVIIPAIGGDTCWANTVAAYGDLQPDLRALVDQLWALHTNDYDYKSYLDYTAHRPKTTDREMQRHRAVFTSNLYETQHPVVRPHPLTGERTLLLGCFLSRFVGWPQAESDRLFEILQNRTIRLENMVRWRWSVGDIVVWDNYATQHYAVNDYGFQDRVMRRVSLQGELPIGLNGSCSVEKIIRGRQVNP
jgi:taurine dioxygenase